MPSLITCRRCNESGLNWATSRRTGRPYLVRPGETLLHPGCRSASPTAPAPADAQPTQPAETVPCRCCQGTGRVPA